MNKECTTGMLQTAVVRCGKLGTHLHVFPEKLKLLFCSEPCGALGRQGSLCRRACLQQCLTLHCCHLTLQPVVTYKRESPAGHIQDMFTGVAVTHKFHYQPTYLSELSRWPAV